MISFLEMAQQYPVGAKVSVPKDNGEKEKQREIIGYEYYNGTGYLLFGNDEKINVEKVISAERGFR